MDSYANQLIAALLLSLRLAPTFAFAPPFTLVRTPASVRVLLGLSLAFWLVADHPEQAAPTFADARLLQAALSELLMGISICLTLQLAFAAMLTAGRALDIQVGFGLAQLADPALRTQMPLVGTLFSYAAAAIFFATGGPADLIAIFARSIVNTPIGAFAGVTDLGVLLGYIGGVFMLAMGLAGPVMLAIFLTDIAVALISRTLPQMNVLVLGFQAKALVLLSTLPFVFAFSGALLLRIVRSALDAMPLLL